MNKCFVGMAVLVSGLFLFCPKVEACDDLPTAGFQEFIKEIECEPITTTDRESRSYVLTEEDADLLLRIGVLEAGETDPEAIADVMQVVLNRFESDIFPNSIRGVIYQDKRFSSAKKLAKANVTIEAEDALMMVVYGQNKDNEALYFESLPGRVWENSYEYLFSYGGHDFYK